MVIYKNIVTDADDTVTTLITKGASTSGNINKISISNVDAKDALSVSVFIEDAATSASTNAGNNKFYFIQGITIPAFTTLVLDDNVSFDKNQYNLRILTNQDVDNGPPNISIIIK
tara:strand:+ start:1463 stop:1807 length:345 start_codon:yes stop_codon:yes gene_type:complete